MKAVSVSLFFIAVQALAVTGPPVPSFTPRQLDEIVSRIALYPDPLLGQALTAATYYDQIPDAARWSDEHHYLRGSELTDALSADNVAWDPSVQALVPFPSVLDMMNSDPAWTQQLGDAFLVQPNDVMDAVQRQRRRSYDYGYLRSNSSIVVHNGPYVEILPARTDYIVVPYYNPVIVYAAPHPGFAVATAIGYGYVVALGTIWAPWGWGTVHFGWPAHTVYVFNEPWHRTWYTRTVYVHHYDVPHHTGAVQEHHEKIVRSAKERDDSSHGRPQEEEHHKHSK